MSLQKRTPPRNIRSIREMRKKEPKVVEGPKNTLVIRGNKTNNVVNSFLADIHRLKGEGTTFYNKKHQVFPFEEFTPLEKYLTALDASLFLFGSSSKKRPQRVIVGRAFDYGLLDMVQFQLTNFVSSDQFDTTAPVHTRPILFFQGEEWESNTDFAKVKPLLQDFFCENRPNYKVDLCQLKLLISFTAKGDVIHLRTYSIKCDVKAIKTLENIDSKLGLEELGPHADLKLTRCKFADDELWKKATQKPAVLKPTKKNLSRDAIGNRKGKVFMDQQNLEVLPVRQRKELKAARKAEQAQKQAEE